MVTLCHAQAVDRNRRPLCDDAGVVAGLLCQVSEDTERVIGARRMATFERLEAKPWLRRVTGATSRPMQVASEPIG